jgi:hypothetical protein
MTLPAKRPTSQITKILYPKRRRIPMSGWTSDELARIGRPTNWTSLHSGATAAYVTR